MKNIRFLSSIIFSLWTAVSIAHGPVAHTIHCKFETNIKTDKLWSVIQDFDNIHSWHPAIISTEANGGNKPGATRILTLKKGGTISEELRKYNESNQSMQYKMTKISTSGTTFHELSGKDIEIPVFPVDKGWKAILSVQEQDNVALVTFKNKGRFYRAYKNNNPPAELSDEVAIKATIDFFVEGLENIKKLVNAQQPILCSVDKGEFSSM